MCAVSIDPGVVRSFAHEYLKKNPKATEAEVQVAAREHFQGKMSRKGLSQIAPAISEVCSANAEQVRANFQPVETPVVNRARKYFRDRGVADRYYFEYNRMSKDARKTRGKDIEKSVTPVFESNENERLEILKRSNPDEYTRELAMIEEQNKPVKSHKAAKREVNAEYQSSKKKKAAKKTAEDVSKAEHKKARMQNTKYARESEYLTKNGLMRTNERKLYESIKSHEIIADAPWKSAEESMQVFIEKGLAPLEDAKPQVTTTTKTSAQNVSEIAEQAAESVRKSLEQSAEKATKNIEKATEKAGKGKWGWIAAGAGVVAAAIGGKAYMDKQKGEQTQLNLSA